MIGLLLAATLASSAPVTAHRLVATTQPLAQQRFDTALTELYAYDGPDAATDFAGAALTDPHLAIALWGKALAEGSDLNDALTQDRFARAHADAQQAKDLETYASPDERQLIDAVALRYAGAFGDAAKDDAAYEAAMRVYVAQHAADNDAAMLLVEAELEAHAMRWNDDGTPSNTTGAEMLRLVQSTLARDPGHLMANHLCIHVYDTAPDRSFAVGCAQRLDAMTFAPGDEHLAHMPAHIWVEIGDGKAALASSERAWALHPTHYASHDAYIALEAALIAGDRSAAQEWSSRLALLGPFHEGAVIDARTSNWQDVAQLKPPQNEFPLVAGLAALRTANVDAAKTDLRALQRSRDRNDAALLGAHIDEAQGDTATAIGLLLPIARSLRSAEEELPFFPPDEALGALYYRTTRFADARQTFSAILAERPDDPRALFGMWQTLLALNDSEDASTYEAAFRQYWAGGVLTMSDF
jgi:hypothetical protein